MTLAAFTSGLWTGFFNDHGGGPRHRMDLSLTFARGIVSGHGRNRSGLFGIAGCYDSSEGEIRWTQAHLGAAFARYRGFADGSTIWGTWEIAGVAKGGFHLWPLNLTVKYETGRLSGNARTLLRSPVRNVQR